MVLRIQSDIYIYIYTYTYVHPVPKLRSCHKAIMVATGRAHCIHNCIYIYLTVFRRTCPQGFAWIRAQKSLAGDSKPRGGSVKPGSGGWPSAWAICWWLAGGQLSKAGGRRGCLARTPPLSQTCQFECHIVLLLAVFVELFGLA